MEFKKTEGSIVTLKNKTSISVDEMLGLVVCAVSDCYKNIGVKDVSGMQVADQKQMILNLNAIASMLLQAANGNAGAFGELKSSISQKIDGTVRQLNDVNAEYDKTSVQVKSLVEEEAQLSSRKKALEDKMREYRKLEAECEQLQESINDLSNASIDEIREKRDGLASDLTERQKRKDGLETEVRKLEEYLKAAQAAVTSADGKRAAIKNSISDAKKERERLEKSIEQLRSDLEEVEKWNREFPEIHKAMLEESKSHESMMAQLRTSMNGIFSDEFLTENLFSQSGNLEKLTPDNYPDLNVVTGKISSVADLKAWSENVMKRIQSLMSIYQEELRRLVECSNFSTEEAAK